VPRRVHEDLGEFGEIVIVETGRAVRMDDAVMIR
jgi:hypothetical protein